MITMVSGNKQGALDLIPGSLIVYHLTWIRSGR
jgi:hypothetical protein